MTERENEGIDRRTFLKMAGAGAIAAATGSLAGCESSEDKERQTIEMMKEATTQMRVDGEEIRSLWDMYEKSGYADLGYAETPFYKAIEELNPESADTLKRRIVYPDQVLEVPIAHNNPE